MQLSKLGVALHAAPDAEFVNLRRQVFINISAIVAVPAGET
jgi:hypothetical protein